jgi:hypothetical protein
MDDFKPSVFTPLRRWFTDERARDTEDLRALYTEVKAQHARSRFSGSGGFVPLIDDVWDDIGFRVYCVRQPVRLYRNLGVDAL